MFLIENTLPAEEEVDAAEEEVEEEVEGGCWSRIRELSILNEYY
jgi:hypothetical protein